MQAPGVCLVPKTFADDALVLWVGAHDSPSPIVVQAPWVAVTLHDHPSFASAAWHAWSVCALVIALRRRKPLLLRVGMSCLASRPYIVFVHKFKRSVYLFVDDQSVLASWQEAANGPNAALLHAEVVSRLKNSDAATALLSAKGAATVSKKKPYPLASRFWQQSGPFDIVGDVHGCFTELMDLLKLLGYQITYRADCYHVSHRQGRRCVLVGDLVDRGPDPVQTLRFAKDLVRSGSGMCVLGNHDEKLCRALKGNRVQMRHGLQETWDMVSMLDKAEQQDLVDFLRSLPLYVLLDQGRLCCVHAGILDKDMGFMSARIKTFCLYGKITGEKDARGFPVRGDWAVGRSKDTLIVYGHTPVMRAELRHRTVNVDTGCAFGGALTAFCYPEQTFVEVPARACYAPGLDDINRLR